MDENINSLLELQNIIYDYDELLEKACGYGIYSDSDYEMMDFLKNRGNELIRHLMVYSRF